VTICVYLWQIEALPGLPAFFRVAILYIFVAMKTASVHEIKQELGAIKPGELVELCLRLARFKKENKELITYLLFEAHDEQSFVDNLKKEITASFGEINQSNLYYVKKSLRKIIRTINKYCRYSSSKQTEVELRIFFCSNVQSSSIWVHRNPAIIKLYDKQLEKINSVLNGLHEDLQYDYRKEVERIS